MTTKGKKRTRVAKRLEETLAPQNATDFANGNCCKIKTEQQATTVVALLIRAKRLSGLMRGGGGEGGAGRSSWQVGQFN